MISCNSYIFGSTKIWKETGQKREGECLWPPNSPIESLEQHSASNEF